MHPTPHDLLALLEAGRQHLLDQHGDPHSLDLARSFEGSIREHARLAAQLRDLHAQLIDQIDNLRSSSERRQGDCLWCCDIACEASEALIATRAEVPE